MGTGTHLLFKLFVAFAALAYVLGLAAIFTEKEIPSILLLLFSSLISTLIIINNHSWRVRKLYWAGFALVSVSPVLVHFIRLYSAANQLWFGYLPFSFMIVLGILQQVFVRITGRYPVYEKPVETREDGLYALLLLVGSLLLAHELYGWVY